jgi:hypothetical protein
MQAPQVEIVGGVNYHREVPRRKHVLQTARKLRAAYPAGERTDLHRGPDTQRPTLAGRGIATL